ncbi:MAG: hypothetical protein HXY49_04110 [Ignavibacteriaceae bacterium]|nr:hypothetical protein [Ignavibacteriaceae bacterium]
MNDLRIKEIINLYFDGELNKKDEPGLFSMLSENEEAREYFKQLGAIRSEIENSAEEIPSELEERILISVEKKLHEIHRPAHKKRMPSLAYVFAVLMILLSLYLFKVVSDYQQKVDNLSVQVSSQSRTIQTLFNSLPAAEVRAKFSNEIIINPNL